MDDVTRFSDTSKSKLNTGYSSPILGDLLDKYGYISHLSNPIV